MVFQIYHQVLGTMAGKQISSKSAANTSHRLEPFGHFVRWARMRLLAHAAPSERQRTRATVG